jgi:hypothetical protein
MMSGKFDRLPSVSKTKFADNLSRSQSVTENTIEG